MSGQDPFDDDPAARALAERLARTDFSAETRVRASLRARLVRRSRGGAPSPLRPRARLALAAAAAAALCLVPFRSRLRGLVERSAGGRPVLVGIGFASIPGSPFVTVTARVESSGGRRAMVWELEGGAIALETRAVGEEGLFEVPTL